MRIIEKKYRTITKIVVWQLLAVCITITILIIAIGDVSKAFTYGIIDHSICLVCHYFYDRVWLKCGWGLSTKEEVKSDDNLVSSDV